MGRATRCEKQATEHLGHPSEYRVTLGRPQESPEQRHWRIVTQRLHEAIEKHTRELSLDDLCRTIADHGDGNDVAEVDAQEPVESRISGSRPVKERPNGRHGHRKCKNAKSLHIVKRTVTATIDPGGCFQVECPLPAPTGQPSPKGLQARSGSCRRRDK